MKIRLFVKTSFLGENPTKNSKLYLDIPEWYKMWKKEVSRSETENEMKNSAAWKEGRNWKYWATDSEFPLDVKMTVLTFPSICWREWLQPPHSLLCCLWWRPGRAWWPVPLSSTSPPHSPPTPPTSQQTKHSRQYSLGILIILTLNLQNTEWVFGVRDYN